MKASLLLSIRYMFSTGPSKVWSLKRIRGGIIGIAVSLVPLVLVFQIANGMIEGITARYVETYSYHLQARSLDYVGPQGIDPGLIDVVASLDGVTYAGPELQGFGLAAGKQGSTGILIRAVPPELADEPGFKAFLRVDAGVFDLNEGNSVVLGREVARQMGAEVGDEIRIVTAIASGAARMIPRISTGIVTGIVSSGYQELDKLWVFLPIERGRRILPPGTGIEFLGVKIREPYALENPLFSDTAGKPAEADLVARANTETGDFRGVDSVRRAMGGGWRIYTWYEQQPGNFLSFLTTRNILLVIMVLIVLVASFNVSSSMIMLVLEKQHEIAILKSIGARPGMIAAIFVTGGLVSGTLGALIGLTLGALVSVMVNEIMTAIDWVVNLFGQLGNLLFSSDLPYVGISIYDPAFYLERIPITIKAGDLLLMGLLTMVLSMVVSLIPAVRAARLRPLQVFRKA